MNFFICVTLLLAATANVHAGYFYPAPAFKTPLYGALSTTSTSLASATQQQYHTQDSFGQYSYGYSEPLSSKQEVRTLDGVTRGSYSYIDSDGKLQTVDYVADAGGFRVSATNLPRPLSGDELKPVEDTPEVAAARMQHLLAFEAAKTRDNSEYVKVSNTATPTAAVPSPVEDTPEVAAAKREFFIRYEQEKNRQQLLQTKTKVAAPAPVYSVLKTQPIVATLPSYAAKILPSANFGYHYNLPVVTPVRTYLPVV